MEGITLNMRVPYFYPTFIKNPISMALIALILLAVLPPFLLEKWQRRTG
jgi:hypothetical protein